MIVGEGFIKHYSIWACMYPPQAGWLGRCHSSQVRWLLSAAGAGVLPSNLDMPFPPSFKHYGTKVPTGGNIGHSTPMCAAPLVSQDFTECFDKYKKRVKRCQGRRGCQCFCCCVGFLSLTRVCYCFGGIVGFGFVFFFPIVLEYTIYFF